MSYTYNIGYTIGDFTIVNRFDDGSIVVRCNICGRLQTLSSSHAFSKRTNIHGVICTKIVIHQMLLRLGLPNSGHWRFYRIWANMRTRTTNPKYEKAHRYIGRGINSDAFRYFVDFFDALYPSYVRHVWEYGYKNTTLDRINNDESYSPWNCRWATIDEQANNRGDLVKFKAISPDGIIYHGTNLTRFCDEHGILVSTASALIRGVNKISRSGWTFEFDKV